MTEHERFKIVMNVANSRKERLLATLVLPDVMYFKADTIYEVRPYSPDMVSFPRGLTVITLLEWIINTTTLEPDNIFVYVNFKDLPAASLVSFSKLTLNP